MRTAIGAESCATPTPNVRRRGGNCGTKAGQLYQNAAEAGCLAAPPQLSKTISHNTLQSNVLGKSTHGTQGSTPTELFSWHAMCSRDGRGKAADWILARGASDANGAGWYLALAARISPLWEWLLRGPHFFLPNLAGAGCIGPAISHHTAAPSSLPNSSHQGDLAAMRRVRSQLVGIKHVVPFFRAPGVICLGV